MTPSQLKTARKRERGECRDCDQPVMPGRSRCAVHLELARQRHREFYERQKNGVPVRGYRRSGQSRQTVEGLAVSFLDRWATALKGWDRQVSPIKWAMDRRPELGLHSIFRTELEDPRRIQAFWLLHYAWAKPLTEEEKRIAARLP